MGVERRRGGRAETDPADAAGTVYPVALGGGVLGAAGGTFAAGAVVPAAVLAVLGALVLATLVAGVGGRR